MGTAARRTGGCSCAQIIEALHLGLGHERYGCSLGAMEGWTQLVSDDDDRHHGDDHHDDDHHEDGHGGE